MKARLEESAAEDPLESEAPVSDGTPVSAPATAPAVVVVVAGVVVVAAVVVVVDAASASSWSATFRSAVCMAAVGGAVPRVESITAAFGPTMKRMSWASLVAFSAGRPAVGTTR